MLNAGALLRDRYCLKQRLNEHPGRQIWLAEDMDEQTTVVVKLLALSSTVGWEELRLFEREAQVLQTLNHPHIPAYREYFSLDEANFWFGLVQDYIPGLSLQQQLAQGRRFEPKEVRQIAEACLGILIYLHQLTPPILHRDIKPSNLIWTAEQQLYLIDFGAVQAQATPTSGNFTVVGTYGYTPTEQFGGLATPASDLYALGATLIHLLTGLAPSELPQQNLRLQFRDRVSPGVEPRFLDWLEQLTEPVPEQRFLSAQAARTALQTTTFKQKQAAPLAPPSTTASAEFQTLPRPTVRIQRSAQQLEIHIPSQFQLEMLYPMRLGLQRLQRRMVRAGKYIWQQWVSNRNQSKLSTPQKRSTTTAAIAVVAATGIGIGALVLVLPFLVSTLPILVIVGLILYQLRTDYFRGSRLYFTDETFEIDRYVAGKQQVTRGKLADLETISVDFISTHSHKVRHSLRIEISPNAFPLFFLANRFNKHLLLGQQLSEAELNSLCQEIQIWLDTYRKK